MDMKTYAVGLCVAAIAVAAMAVAPVAAETKKKQYVYTTAPRPPRNSPAGAGHRGAALVPRRRDRSAAGRAQVHRLRLPCGLIFDAVGRGAPIHGGRVGWHQSPLPGPFDLPSRYNPYGW